MSGERAALRRVESQWRVIASLREDLRLATQSQRALHWDASPAANRCGASSPRIHGMHGDEDLMLLKAQERMAAQFERALRWRLRARMRARVAMFVLHWQQYSATRKNGRHLCHQQARRKVLLLLCCSFYQFRECCVRKRADKRSGQASHMSYTSRRRRARAKGVVFRWLQAVLQRQRLFLSGDIAR